MFSCFLIISAFFISVLTYMAFLNSYFIENLCETSFSLMFSILDYNFSGFWLLLLLTLIVTSMFYVIFLKKFISSLTHMITAFVLIAVLLFSLNLDFLAILTLLIYIGALLIFFLFAILLLLKFFSFKQLFSINNVLFYSLELFTVFVSFAILSSSYFELVYSSNLIAIYFTNPLVSLVLFFYMYILLSVITLGSLPGDVPNFLERWVEASSFFKKDHFTDKLNNSLFAAFSFKKEDGHGLENAFSDPIDSYKSLQISHDQFKNLYNLEVTKIYPFSNNTYFPKSVVSLMDKSYLNSKKVSFYLNDLTENELYILNPYLKTEIECFSSLNSVVLPIYNFIPSFFGDSSSICYSLDTLELLLEETGLFFNENFSLNFLNSLSTLNLAKTLVEFNNIQLYGYTLYTKDGLAMILVSILLLSVVIISALKITTLVYSNSPKTQETV